LGHTHWQAAVKADLTMKFPSLSQTANIVSGDDDGMTPLDVLDVLRDERWVVAVVAALGFLFSCFHAYRQTPLYESNTLIQVEDTKPGSVGQVLGQAGGVGASLRPPSDAEIEIMRSRLVVGQAVKNLRMDQSAYPLRPPYIGEWLARGATGPSEPGFLWMDGVVTGNESLELIRLNLPPSLQGQGLKLVVTQTGYRIFTGGGESLGDGVIGQPYSFLHQGQPGEVWVNALVGKPGAVFILVAQSTLSLTLSMQSQLQIAEIGRGSGVMRVSMVGPDPVLITQFLNEVGRLYVKQNIERNVAEAEKSLIFLNAQLPVLRGELENAEAKFNEFRNLHGSLDLNSEAQILLSQASSLKQRQQELQQRRRELLTRYTPQHPSVQSIDSQLQVLAEQNMGYDAQVAAFPRLQQEQLRLMRDVTVSNNLYTGLLNTLQQLKLVKEGKVGSVRVIDVAVIPEGPFSPNRPVLLLMGGMISLVIGCLLAFLKHKVKRVIRDPEEIEQKLGLSIFATVPLSEAQLELENEDSFGLVPGQQKILAFTSPSEPAVESLRSLRTSVQFALSDSADRKVIIMTGPTPGVGKSFNALNLAAVTAAAGKRVLLVDADMRKGHIHKFLGLNRGPGLHELLAGERSFEQVLHRDVVPGLDFVPTGAVTNRAADFLSLPSTAELLRLLEAKYDMVIMDTPPVLAVADAVVLAPCAGLCLIVARAEQTGMDELRETHKRLVQGGSMNCGAIFNGLDLTRRYYGYAASKYRGYYSYNYGTAKADDE
jgi:tyrosine-protein kinase Etk/Wzc